MLQMDRILMVCLGNICRSPMAEGILRHKAESKGIPLRVDSAGTGGWHTGAHPDPRAIHTARIHGVDISGIRVRKLEPKDFTRFDLIYVMDRDNYRQALSLNPLRDQRPKVRMLLNELTPGEDREVPDPWFDDQLFEPVFQLLDQACSALLAHLNELTRQMPPRSLTQTP